MSIRLVIDGNAVYEIDEDCESCQRTEGKEERTISRRQEDDRQHKTAAGRKTPPESRGRSRFPE